MTTKMKEYSYFPEGSLLGSEENDYYTSDLWHLERAMHSGVILEGIVKCCSPESLDLTVEVGQFRGIIPHSEAVFTANGEEIKDIAVITRVGKATAFKIIEITRSDSGEPLLILSRKAAQEECARNFIANLRAGDIIPALVTHLEPFGAFVDIGCGNISLLTVDAISVSRISHPRDRFKCGDQIMAVVRSVDRETGRIYMSCRELLGTWEENAAEFKISQTVSGIVRSIESYGIFVELTPNLAGLAEYREGVELGDICAVYIKSIIPERMKIKLVMIDSAKGNYEPRMKYFVDFSKIRHIDSWRYSPECSSKMIESVFEN